jgi:hypothetical protein
MLFFQTASQNLGRLNNTCGAFEYEVDSAGSTISKVWEWKQRQHSLRQEAKKSKGMERAR